MVTWLTQIFKGIWASGHVTRGECSTHQKVVLFCFNNSSFYRAMHFSAKRGIAIVCCPSVRDIEVCFSHRLEYFKNNFTAE